MVVDISVCVHPRQDVELVNVLMVGRLLTPKVVEGGDMACDVDKAIGRKQVEHERAASRVASGAFSEVCL